MGHVVLHPAPLARLGATAAHPVDQALVDLADQALADLGATRQVLAHQLEGAAVVPKLPHVFLVGVLHLAASPKLGGLLDAKLGRLYVGGVVGLKQQGPLTHHLHPLLGQRRRFEETPGALNGRKIRCQRVGDGETWLK